LHTKGPIQQVSTVTAFALLVWINAALLLQVAVFGSVAFYRHWQNYQALRRRSGETGIADVPLSMPPKAQPAWNGFREFVVQRKDLDDASGSVCSFYLAPLDGQPLPAFRPGQFLTFSIDLGARGETNKPIVRCYSLSDRPRPNCYRISVKRVLPPPSNPMVPPGVASNHLHDHVSVGDRLRVRAPSGHFHLHGDGGPVVLIAGGIGITPMLSIMNAALHEDPLREIWFFYGVRNGVEHAMKTHLVTMVAQYKALHLHISYSQPRPDDIEGRDFHRRGHIDLALLRMTLPLRPMHFFICGPRQMMETLVPALENWGVPGDRIHYEAFGPASLARHGQDDATTERAAKTFSVTFRKSGTQATWDNRSASLLEFGEGLGLQLDSGCRAGSCGSCQVTLVAGEVAYDQRPEVDLEPGNCLLCITRPRTDVVLHV
jgi:uncharacterized protein